MNILIAERPSENGYIESLIKAYRRQNNTVICDASNFYYSDYVPDVLHIHWPESLYKWYSVEAVNEVSNLEIIQERLRWYKKNGVLIIHTIHNVLPHNSEQFMDKDIFKLIIEYSDILVHHCPKSANEIERLYGNTSSKKNIICPHGDYQLHYKSIDQGMARQRYGIPPDKTVILNFGRQRPYKNEKFIGSVFNRLDFSKKYLFIAGMFENPGKGILNKYYYRIRNGLRERVKSSNKKYIYKQFPVAEIPYILSSADVVFLAQQHGLNSGLLSLAATYGKPVVCPDIGCFGASLSDWVHETYEAGNPDDAINALKKVCTKADKAKELSQIIENKLWLKKYSWDNHVQQIMNTIKEFPLSV